MAEVLVELPIYYFGSPNKGGPLFNAKIYVGEPDLDPRLLANRKDIVFRNEDGTDVPISASEQPVRTSSGGYPTYNGQIGQILVDGNYSIAVDSSQDAQQYYWPNFFKGQPILVGDESLIDHSGLSNREAPNSHPQYIEGVTVSQLSTGDYPVGSTLRVKDRGNGIVNIVAGGTSDGFGVLDAGSGNTATFDTSQSLIPEYYGVDGSASALDKNAWMAVLSAATTNGLSVKCMAGATYLFNPDLNGNVIATPKEGESLIFDGNYATFKMADGMTNASGRFFHTILVSIRTLYGATDVTADTVVFKRMILDGNLRGQPLPPVPSAYEQRATLKVQVIGSEGNILKNVKISNCQQVDPQGDGLQIGPSETVATATAPIHNATVDKYHCGVRTGVRAAIAIGSGCSRINLSNITRDDAIVGGETNSIETEFSQIGTQKVEVNMTNVFIDDIELGSPVTADDQQVRYNLNNVHTAGFFLVVGGSINAVNSTLRILLSNTQRVSTAKFSNTVFQHVTYDDGGTQEVRGISLTFVYPNTEWLEVDCDHVIVGDSIDSGAIGAAIDTGNSPATELGNHVIKLTGVTFDPLFPRSVAAYAGGEVYTYGCTMAGTDTAARCGGFSSFAGSYYSHDDDWTAVTGDTIRVLSPVPNGSQLQVYDGQWNTFNIVTTGSLLNDITTKSTRKMQASSAPAGGGLLGDTVELDAASYTAATAGDPVEWKAVVSGGSSATWIPTLLKP